MKFPFEHKSQRLLPFPQFLQRVFLSIGVGCCCIGVSLFVGMVGYHHFEKMDWLDSFLNASMLLSGMGPLDSPKTASGKLFAGCYALYSGFAVLVIVGISLGPIAHRLLHKLHIDDPDYDPNPPADKDAP